MKSFLLELIVLLAVSVLAIAHGSLEQALAEGFQLMVAVVGELAGRLLAALAAVFVAAFLAVLGSSLLMYRALERRRALAASETPIRARH